MLQFTEIRRSKNLLWNLTLRELRARYRKSFLGWAWSMLNPLSNMLIYWFVFGVVFGATAPIGHPSGIQVYAHYLLTGILPWGFFSLVTNLGVGSLLGNSAHYLREHNTLSPTTVMFQDIVDSVNP